MKRADPGVSLTEAVGELGGRLRVPDARCLELLLRGDRRGSSLGGGEAGPFCLGSGLLALLAGLFTLAQGRDQVLVRRADLGSRLLELRANFLLRRATLGSRLLELRVSFLLARAGLGSRLLELRANFLVRRATLGSGLLQLRAGLLQLLLKLSDLVNELPGKFGLRVRRRP